MLICGLDIETTGLDHGKDNVTELAWVIKAHGSEKPLVMKSHFIVPPYGAGDDYLSPQIKDLTKIEMKHLESGLPFDLVMTELAEDMEEHSVDFVAAHNGEGFDRPFLRAKVSALSVSANKCAAGSVLADPWIDTSVDVIYPEHCRQNNLLYLAAYHGFLNPFPHAALFDVMTMLKILDCYPLEPVVERAKSPWCFVSADVGFENKQLAKSRRYYWETFGTAHFPRTWVKRIKEMDYEKECSEAPFKVHKI